MFKKAEKTKSKLRLAICGASGAGKSFTALRIATGMAAASGLKIAAIDSEKKSLEKYADRFVFDLSNEFDRLDIDTLLKEMDDAEKDGYEILIIDSLTHPWKNLLDEVDKIASGKCRGNSFGAWRFGTPKQNRLIERILQSPCHIIATMRSKMEWVIEEQGGKTKPVRVGLAPEQGKNIEFEFDMLMELSVDHVANILKDRTGKFQDAIIDKPGEEFGKELLAWLNDGAEPKKQSPRRSEVPPAAADEMPLPSVKAIRVINDVMQKLEAEYKDECEQNGVFIDRDLLTACIYGAHRCHIEDMGKVKQIMAFICDDKRGGLARVCYPIDMKDAEAPGPDEENLGDYGEAAPANDYPEPEEPQEEETQPEPEKPKTKQATAKTKPADTKKPTRQPAAKTKAVADEEPEDLV